MNTRDLTYQEILSIRKENRFINKIPPILFYDDLGSGEYNLWIKIDGNTLYCNLTDSGEITDFESNVKPYCNKYDVPSSKIIKTHDFSDNTNWINGASESVYCIQPDSGKDLIVKQINGKIDKGTTFTSGQEFELVIWQSLGASCPSYSNTSTAYGSPLYNPGGGVYTGWLKVYPATADVQEASVFVYFDTNVPQYMVTEFCYYSLDDFKDKAEFREDGDTLRFKYEFIDYGAFVALRSSLNERIEMFTSNNNILQKPVLSQIKSVVSAIVLEYNSF